MKRQVVMMIVAAAAFALAPSAEAATWTVDLDRENVVTNVPLGLGKTSTLTIPKSEFANPHGKKTATLLFDGTWWHLECEGHIDEDSVLEPLNIPARPFPAGTRRFESAPIDRIQGWKPKGHNASVGDVTGIWYKGRLHVFYLADRRNHGSKGGTGGHSFAHLSSADLVSWREHPEAVPVTEWWQTVGTGTPFVMKDGRLALAYGFHTERMQSPKAKGKPRGATYAVSDDGGETFRQTGEFFHETRNPTVYNRADGRYGMVCGYGMGGIYASDDLKKWELVDDTTGAKGDCPCYFAWNGHHYLLQGFRGHEFLRHSKTGKPGSWEDWGKQIPALYAGLIVPMVVEIPGNRRLLLGWRSATSELWGGVMEIREVFQAADGSLRSELLDIRPAEDCGRAERGA